MPAHDGPSALQCLARHTPEMATLDIDLHGVKPLSLPRLEDLFQAIEARRRGQPDGRAEGSP